MFALSYTLLLSVLIFFVTAYENLFSKCSIKDETCMAKEWEKVLIAVGSTGIPEINVKPIDPILFKNVTVTIIDGASLTIKTGSIRGFKYCKIPEMHINLEKKLESKRIICDTLNMRGYFHFGGTNPMLASMFGTNSSNGHGRLKIKFEQVSMNIKVSTTVIKKEDGEAYLKTIGEKLHYTFDIQNAGFDIKRLIVGGSDMSEIATAFLSNNGRNLIQAFGKPLIDKCLEKLAAFGGNVRANIPAKDFILEDLTPYITN